MRDRDWWIIIVIYFVIGGLFGAFITVKISQADRRTPTTIIHPNGTVTYILPGAEKGSATIIHPDGTASHLLPGVPGQPATLIHPNGEVDLYFYDKAFEPQLKWSPTPPDERMETPSFSLGEF